MIDKEQLRYDLALHAAAVMTLRNNLGNPPDMMLSYFREAYRQYWQEERLRKQLDEIAKELSQNIS